MTKRKIISKMFVCNISLLFIALFAGAINGFSAVVNENEAVAIADFWFAMELNSGYLKIDETERAERLEKLQTHIVLYLVSKDDLLATPSDETKVLAYVIKYEPTGFVVVSGEDRIEPIIVFDVKSKFRWAHPELNFLRYFLGREMVTRWENLRPDVHPNWRYLRSKLKEAKGLEEVTFEAPEKSIYILWDTALWGQGQFYNDVVVAQNGNTAGIPTGCTATAMAIKMRFHEWPLSGNSSHNYCDNTGTTQFCHSVNFGAQTYGWAQMPTTSLTAANLDVANLMYHSGVAVNMDYEVGSSGAWPSALSMNTYFRYRGTTDINSNHDQPMIDSIRGVLPVVLSSSAHTVVADGYRDTMSPYFHLNVGWDGSNNGWYNLNQIPGGDPTIDRSYPYSSPTNYIYVDANWSGSENGNIQNPYNTISEGESAAPAGGHLWIKAGIYSGAGNVPITINKAMTIGSYEGTATIQ